MKFPFSISKTIKIEQKDYQISSEGYLLNHIEERLQLLNMGMRRISSSSLFLYKNDIIKGFRQKDLIDNLLVEVKFENTKIIIKLTSNTILLSVITLALLLLFLVQQNENHVMPLFFPMFALWIFAYLIKSVMLYEIKKDLDRFLRAKNNL